MALDNVKETVTEGYDEVKETVGQKMQGARGLAGAMALSVGVLGAATGCDDKPFEPTDGEGKTEQVAGPYAETDNNLSRLAIDEIEESAVKINGRGLWKKVKEDVNEDASAAQVYEADENSDFCTEPASSDDTCFVIDYEDERDELENSRNAIFQLSGSIEEQNSDGEEEDGPSRIAFSWHGTGGFFLNTDYDDDGDEDTLIGTVNHVVNPPKQFVYKNDLYELQKKDLFYMKEAEGNKRRPGKPQPIEVEYSDPIADVAVASSEAEEEAYNLFSKKEGLKPGHFVAHIGNPLMFDGTYTEGKVSNPEVFRSLFFSTQMPINPGDSGSPVYVLDEENGEPLIAGYASWGIPSAENVGGISHTQNLLRLLEMNGANVQASVNAVQLEEGDLEGEIEAELEDFDVDFPEPELRE